jgi:mannose-6-phosphate isomerase
MLYASSDPVAPPIAVVPSYSFVITYDPCATTTVAKSGTAGLSRLPDGSFLRDAIAADPAGYLGARHVRAFGADPKLLVKLLHTGERLFCHFHPDAAFAGRHFGLPSGKNEAWIVLATDTGQPVPAWLGFRRLVTAPELLELISSQDSGRILAAMNQVELRAGTTLFVPARQPHAIGAGVLILELQEPVDVSMIFEHSAFPRLDASQAFLGLSASDAVSGVAEVPLEGSDLAALQGEGVLGKEMPGVFTPPADRYFRARRVAGSGRRTLDPAYSVLIVDRGAGILEWGAGQIDLHQGDTVLVPFGAGTVELTGDLDLFQCLPPDPPDAAQSERHAGQPVPDHG